MFDIQNAMTRQQLNAQYANQANMYNLQRQQQVADMNLQQLNQEIYRQQYLAPQQMFANQMAIANAKAGVLAQQAGLAQQQAMAQSQADMNLMMGLGQGALAMGQMQQNNQMMQMYGAKEGLIQDASGKWIKAGQAVAPAAIPSVNNPYGLSQMSLDLNALPDYVAPQQASQQAFNLGFQRQMAPVVNMGPSSYAYPGMGPQASFMPNDPLALAMRSQMGMGGNQAGMPVYPNASFNPFGPNYQRNYGQWKP